MYIHESGLRYAVSRMASALENRNGSWCIEYSVGYGKVGRRSIDISSSILFKGTPVFEINEILPKIEEIIALEIGLPGYKRIKNEVDIIVDKLARCLSDKNNVVYEADVRGWLNKLNVAD